MAVDRHIWDSQRDFQATGRTKKQFFKIPRELKNSKTYQATYIYDNNDKHLIIYPIYLKKSIYIILMSASICIYCVFFLLYFSLNLYLTVFFLLFIKMKATLIDKNFLAPEEDTKDP